MDFKKGNPPFARLHGTERGGWFYGDNEIQAHGTAIWLGDALAAITFDGIQERSPLTNLNTS